MIDLDDNVPGLGLKITDKYKSEFKIIEYSINLNSNLSLIALIFLLIKR